MIALISNTTSRYLSRVIFIGCLLLAGPVRSEVIHEHLGNGLVVSAEYLQSDNRRSPILILHGFLQTRDFFTVRRLADALKDAGYPVLLPNLSLGIDHRRQSLACEAIHTHSMKQDVSEVAFWVNWLSHRTGQPVTLIGHSIGSLMLLAYLDRYHDAPVEKSIFISLIPFAQGPIAKAGSADKRRAETDLLSAGDKMHRYPLAFCDKYTTTPGNYLSYLDWDQPRALNTIVGLKRKPSIILGSKDIRLGAAWKPRLQALKADIFEIEGANHFFDHTHEFDLFDTIEQLL
ncbi:MAG: alpha/beta fold hydrolase [Candidatus Thiodiazotropha sp. (ex Dulcina madagascariensis)]|nr:alpha/beta fold hydrolase [Candidatus Thiodiazotropha sp. (ex Dulcina madagascariensis)]